MSLSDFTIINKIGQGAYSSVLKVKRKTQDQVYALKQVKINSLKQKQKDNALNEVRLLASINEDYIIKYKEAFFDSKSNTLCIVMEYADGGDLEKLIEKKKKLLSWFEESEVFTMMTHILTGLSSLHERNIIHRDLKCANIFISNKIYKIADLNVSKILKKQLAYTQTGTPYYASPQVWQDKPYNLKSDIWSFGCIAYQMCTLKPPFTATSMQGLFKKVKKGVYPCIPSTYSKKLAKLIDSCLQLDPEKRPCAQQLLMSIDDDYDQYHSKPRISSINLLNTIKMPKNPEYLKNQLPKADYQNGNIKSLNNLSYHRFDDVNQERLKQIVKAKQQQQKRQIPKRLKSQMPVSLRLIDQIKNQNGNISLQKKKQLKSELLQGLPKIKNGSQPNKLDRINQIISKARNVQARKIDYGRPMWWG